MRLLSTTTRNLEMNLRSEISRSLQHLSIGYYARHSTGALQAKLLRDVESIQQLLMGVFEPLLSLGMAITAAMAITAIRVPWFLLIYGLSVPPAALVVYKLRRPIRDRTAALRQAIASMSARLSEMTQLIPMTRAHGAEHYELEKVERRLAQVREAGRRVDAITAVFGSTAFVVLQLLSAVVLGLAAWLYITQQITITISDVVLLTGYFNFNDWHSLRLAQSHPTGHERLRGNSLSRRDPGRSRCGGECGQDQAQSSDRSHNLRPRPLYVSRYGSNGLARHSPRCTSGGDKCDREIVGRGQDHAIKSGVGFLRPTAGHVFLDGQDMSTLDLRTYRRFLSVVSPETILFQGTSRENVTYSSRAVIDKPFIQVLRDANALEFVENVRQAEIRGSVRGARISGGQKQRLAIARALLRDPRVLILDEATSALDTISESLIQQALARLMRGRPLAFHMRNADRIVVMEHGRIVEVGTHTELLAQAGMYYQLQPQQIGFANVDLGGTAGSAAVRSRRHP